MGCSSLAAALITDGVLQELHAPMSKGEQTASTGITVVVTPNHSLSREVMTTVSPSRRKRSASALPIPGVAPKTQRRPTSYGTGHCVKTQSPRSQVPYAISPICCLSISYLARSMMLSFQSKCALCKSKQNRPCWMHFTSSNRPASKEYHVEDAAFHRLVIEGAQLPLIPPHFTHNCAVWAGTVSRSLMTDAARAASRHPPRPPHPA
jgi:hypothetical protein